MYAQLYLAMLAKPIYFIFQMSKPHARCDCFMASMSASHEEDYGFAPRSGHTTDHHNKKMY